MLTRWMIKLTAGLALVWTAVAVCAVIDPQILLHAGRLVTGGWHSGS
jgi:hypothetical protein